MATMASHYDLARFGSTGDVGFSPSSNRYIVGDGNYFLKRWPYFYVKLIDKCQITLGNRCWSLCFLKSLIHYSILQKKLTK
jgi:hypothetical protein